MEITAKINQEQKLAKKCDSLNLTNYVISTIVNHKENYYDSTEVIAAAANDPDFLIRTIDHIIRSNCLDIDDYTHQNMTPIHRQLP